METVFKRTVIVLGIQFCYNCILLCVRLQLLTVFVPPPDNNILINCILSVALRLATHL
jgi:hypothetical protein